MDVADLPASRRKVVVALVPLNARQLNQRRCHHMNGIAGQVRVGDVALHALTVDLPVRLPRRPFLMVSPVCVLDTSA